MPTLPLTRSKHLLPFAAVLRQHGEPVGHMLRMAGLPAACLDDPETLVPVAATTRFRELCAEMSGLPNIALTATEHLEIKDLGNLGKILLRSPTLQQALFELRRLVGTQSSNLAIDMRRQPDDDLRISHRVLSEIGRGEWHRALYTLIVMLKVVRIVDPAWSPPEIWVDSKAAPGRFEAIESLGATACFGQHCTGFVVPVSMLAQPVTTNPRVEHKVDIGAEQLWSMSPATTYSESLQQMIRSYARDGWMSIEAASEAAGTSVRTMQRRLSVEQTTYSQVVETTRAKMAGRLLEGTDATMVEIAHELGYKHQGDFTRAFRRWAGVSPSEFRRWRRRS